jgi:ribosome-binding protein aMBF1 (putative translation factor)
MSRQIITQGGKPAFVVIPIEEWRRIEATLEDRTDAAAVRTFLKNPTETFPDDVVSAILSGTSPLKALREHRGLTQAGLAKASTTSAVYISQIERGERRAGRKLLAKLGKALQVEAGLLEQPD